MSSTNIAEFHKRITLAGSLIAIGIVFGDIGTSPLYTLNAVFHGQRIAEDVALGSLSCVCFGPCFFKPHSSHTVTEKYPLIIQPYVSQTLKRAEHR